MAWSRPDFRRHRHGRSAGVTVANLSVRFVTSEAAIPTDLWDACFPPPLEGRWWYQALEASGLEDQFTFLYAVIEEDAKPVGIAPLFTMMLPLGLTLPQWLRRILSGPARTFAFLADPLALFVGSPCSDEGAVGLLPGIERRDTLLCLQDALEAEVRRRDAAMLVWKDFPEAYEGDFTGLASQRRLFRATGFPGTVVDIPNGRKEDYLASLTAKRRWTLKRKLRRGRDRAAVEIEIVQNPDTTTVLQVSALFRNTYEKAKTKFEHLDQEFFEAIATKGASHFLLLRESDSRQIVAFMLCFDMGSQIINKFIGIDYTKPRDWMLYFRLWDAALDWSLARGAISIQSGQTGYAAKIGIGHRLVPLTSYCHHRNRFLHHVFALIGHRITWRTLDPDLANFLDAHPEAEAPERLELSVR